MTKARTPKATSFKWPHVRRGPWVIELTWGLVEGRVECVGFSVEAVGRKQAVTSTILRSIPLASLIEERRAERERWLRLSPGQAQRHEEFAEKVRSFGIKYREVPARRRGGRPRIELDQLAEAAEVYDNALQRGDSAPTRSVAEHFGMARSTAAKWVMRAREEGLLDRPEKRRTRGKGKR